MKTKRKERDSPHSPWSIQERARSLKTQSKS
jgi:hypothetical protein